MLASVLGKIISLELSHGMLSRVTTRSGYVLLATHTEKRGWKGLLRLDEQTLQELRYFLLNIEEMNGSPIRLSLKEIRVDLIVRNPDTSVETIKVLEEGNMAMVSDSSDSKAFVCELTGEKGIVDPMSFRITAEEASLSSGGRELLVVLYTLCHWKKTKFIDN